MNSFNITACKNYKRRWVKEIIALSIQAWPLSLSFLGHMAMGITDSIMVGRLGSIELAAVSLGATIYFVIFLINLGIVVSITPLVSQYLGARKPRMIRRVTRQGIWAGILLSIPGLIILWYIEPILNLINQPVEITKLLGIYMRANMWSLMPGIIFVAVRSFMIALNASKPIMLITTLAFLTNITLNYILIYGNFGFPRLEIFGAGLASAIVTLFEFLLIALIACFMRPYKKYNIFGNIWRSDWPIFRRIFTLGTPVAIGLLMEEGFFLFCILMMGYISATAMAAHAMVANLVIIAYMISLGIATAASARVGHAFGRNDFAALKIAGWAATHLTLMITATIAIFLFIFPEATTRIFLDGDIAENRDTLTLATGLIAFAAFVQITDGTQVVLVQALHGLSDTKIPMILNFVGFWLIGITTAYLFAFTFDYGAYGIWIGYYFASISTAILYILRYYIVSKNAHKRQIG